MPQLSPMFWLGLFLLMGVIFFLMFSKLYFWKLN